jgi:hypothetical protein
VSLKTIMSAVVLAILSVNVAVAKIVPTKARTTAKATAPRIKPIDALINGIFLNSVVDQTSLYQRCLNTNVKALLWGLEGYKDRLSIEKSEFETDLEFLVRKDKMDDALNGDRTIIVCKSVIDNEDVSFNYKAEERHFLGSFNSNLRADLDWKKTGSYVSKTRMGVSARVLSYMGIDYNVDMSSTLSNVKNDCADGRYGRVSFTVPIPLSDAPAVKRDGYLVILGHLRSPFFSETHDTGNPTLDDPRDVNQYVLTANFTPNELLIVMPGGSVPWRCKL